MQQPQQFHNLVDYTKGNPLNTKIAENMVDVNMLQRGDGAFEEKVCQCFSRAEAIFFEILNEKPLPVWKLPTYYEMAGSGYQGNSRTIIEGVTLCIVLIYLERYLIPSWKELNKAFFQKLKSHVNDMALTTEEEVVGLKVKFPVVEKFSDVYKILSRDTETVESNSFEDSSERVEEVIDEETAQIYDSKEAAAEIEKIKKAVEDLEDRHSITSEQFHEIFSNGEVTSKEESKERTLISPQTPETEVLQAKITKLETKITRQEGQLVEANNTNAQQATRIKELQAEVEELQKKLIDSSAQHVWIDWLDWDVFHTSIKAEEVYNTIDKLATPELGEKAKCYAFYRVIFEIKWLKKGAAQKDVLKWWSAHFGCEWHSDNQLKFTELPEAITKATTIDQWKNTGGNNNEHYYNYAQDLKKAFAWNNGRGQYETKQQFVKVGCLPPEKCK